MEVVAAEEVRADVDAKLRAERRAAQRFLDRLRAEACGLYTRVRSASFKTRETVSCVALCALFLL